MIETTKSRFFVTESKKILRDIRASLTGVQYANSDELADLIAGVEHDIALAREMHSKSKR